MARHLSLGQLLRYLDGELSNSAARKTTEHLQTCSNCALERDRLRQQLATIREAQVEVFEPSLPPPPKPWPRLEPRLESVGNKRLVPFWKPLVAFVGGLLRPPLAYAGTALTLLLIALLVWGPIAPVSAKEVIQRATAADGQRLTITPQQVVRQQVRVKKTTRLASAERTTQLESWKSTRSTYWKSGGNSVNTELLAHYKANGLASALPLSPVALDAWLKLAGSEPSASREKEKIKVQAVSNAEARAHGLEEVSFEVQERGWHVDEMTLSFNDAIFQIEEEKSSILARREVPADVVAALEPQVPKHTTHPALQTPSVPSDLAPTVNIDDLEMAVRYDIHRAGPDLGEGIEIEARPPGELVVNAWGVSSQRKEQLEALLAQKPGVVLQFDAPADVRQGRTNTITAVPSTSQQQDSRLLTFFGGADAEENYTRSVLQASTGILAHLYALRDLAVRWPTEQEASLSAGAQAQLAAMVRDHAREVQAGVAEMKSQVDFLLKGLGSQAPGNLPGVVGAATNWQSASTSSLDSARSVDHILRSLLTTSDTPMSVDEALPKLQQSVQELDRGARDLASSAR